MAAVNEFASDTHRRVAANCGQPRSATDLARILGALDPYVDDAAYTVDGVIGYLEGLEADGLVKRFGPYEAAAKIITDIRDDKAVPTLPEEKADALFSRIQNPNVFPYPEREEQWVMTDEALARLTGVAPGTPAEPLPDAVIEQREEANRQLAKADEELVAAERKRIVEGLRERADELEAEE